MVDAASGHGPQSNPRSCGCMNASWYMSLAMERFLFPQHPVDHPGELPGGGHNGFTLPFFLGDAVVEGSQVALAAGDVHPGALDEEESDGGRSPFGDTAMVGGIR